MGEPADRGAVAEDDDLPGILHNLVAASVDFAHEQLHALEALDVPCLAPYHAAPLHGFRREEVMQPDLGREEGVAVLHVVSMRGWWLRWA